MLDAYASKPHYLSHVAPIWRAFPDRGELYVHPHAAQRATELGLNPIVGPPPQGPGNPVIVGGYKDEELLTERQLIVVEHGAGQRYDGYSAQIGTGVPDRPNVLAHLVPGFHAYKGLAGEIGSSKVVMVGSPRLEQMMEWKRELDKRLVIDEAVVGFAFHWDCPIWPESRSAFDQFKRAIGELDLPQDLVGTAHPRDQREAPWRKKWYAEHGIKWFDDLDQMLLVCDLLVCDNSSAIWEACALGIPVVLLDRYDYRPQVEHGLRFWEYADVGPRISVPTQLERTITAGFEKAGDYKARREEAARYVYGDLDGKSLERALSAIEFVLRP